MLKKTAEYLTPEALRVGGIGDQAAVIVLTLLALNGENFVRAREEASYNPRARQNQIVQRQYAPAFMKGSNSRSRYGNPREASPGRGYKR